MNHGIFLRCHTCILDEETLEKGGKRKQDPLPRHVLVLDTETTTDALQTLNFGVHQFCELTAEGKYRCLEEGIFYGDELGPEQRGVLHAYVTEQNEQRTIDELKLRLYERRVFVERVMYTAVQAGAAIVAFNLPFDLSRLAVEYRVARGAGGRGWSFVVFRYKNKSKGEWVPNSFRPRIQLRPKDSKAAFIRLAGGDMNQPYRVGRFLDLKTLVWALRNKSLSLDSACREFKAVSYTHLTLPTTPYV